MSDFVCQAENMEYIYYLGRIATEVSLPDILTIWVPEQTPYMYCRKKAKQHDWTIRHCNWEIVNALYSNGTIKSHSLNKPRGKHEGAIFTAESNLP